MSAPNVSAKHFLGGVYASAARFTVSCETWTAALGFSEIAGFTSQVEHQEYAYNHRFGHMHTKQYGRNVPPSMVLRRGLDTRGFAQLMAWHTLARQNVPIAKVTATFTIWDAANVPVAACVLDRAWCSKVELDSVKAGSSDVVMISATIECDSIILI